MQGKKETDGYGKKRERITERTCYYACGKQFCFAKNLVSTTLKQTTVAMVANMVSF